MANKARGEHSFEYDGQDFTAVLDFNAWADLEDETGMKMQDFLKELDGNPSAKMLRAFVKCAVSQEHPDVDLRTAGRMITAVPDLIGDILVAAFPEAKGEVEKAKKKASRAAK